MPKKFGRIHLVVMDSVGIGAAPDADKFFNHDIETHEAINDVNSDTIGHISKIGLGKYPARKSAQNGSKS